MSKHVCRAPGCARIAVDAKYCVEHQYLENAEREKKPKYFYGAKPSQWPELYASSKWKEMSKKKLHDDYVCQKCGMNRATDVHHIIPHRGNTDLFYSEDNLVSLCKQCHGEETRRESEERQKQKERKRIVRKLWY